MQNNNNVKMNGKKGLMGMLTETERAENKGYIIHERNESEIWSEFVDYNYNVCEIKGYTHFGSGNDDTYKTM